MCGKFVFEWFLYELICAILKQLIHIEIENTGLKKKNHVNNTSTFRDVLLKAAEEISATSEMIFRVNISH